MPTGGADIGLAGAFLGGGSILGDVASGALLGGGLGGLEGAFTGGNIGKDILKGAAGGAFTGGGIGLGGDLLSGALGATGAEALGGAAGGAMGGLATGGNPLTSAVEGGISGGIAGSGVLSGSPTGTSAAGAASSAPGGTASAPGGISPDAASTGNLSDSINTQIAQIGQGVNNSGDLGTVGSPNSATSLPGTPSVSGGNTGTFNYNLSGAPTGSSLNSAASVANGAGSTGGGGTFSNLISGAETQLGKNPIGIATAGLGLGLDALEGNKQSGAEKNLVNEASGLANQGNQLEGYLQSGQLPAGLQAGLNQATESAKATIRSQFAAQGLSGSSAEQQALAQVDMQAQAQSSQMAEQLLTTGINETGMASQLYQDLIKNQMTQDQNLSGAVSNFASAAAGGGGGGINAQQLFKALGSGGQP